MMPPCFLKHRNHVSIKAAKETLKTILEEEMSETETSKNLIKNFQNLVYSDMYYRL